MIILIATIACVHVCMCVFVCVHASMHVCVRACACMHACGMNNGIHTLLGNCINIIHLSRLNDTCDRHHYKILVLTLIPYRCS